jgi:hypothetical protein
MIGERRGLLPPELLPQIPYEVGIRMAGSGPTVRVRLPLPSAVYEVPLMASQRAWLAVKPVTVAEELDPEFVKMP